MPPLTKKRKPKVSVVGAGRLGTALAIALSRKGYSLEYMVANHLKHAHKATILLDGHTRPLAAKELDHLPLPDLVLIATPDDQIAQVARVLSRLENTQRKPTVLHTSGALSSKVLAPLGKKGWSIGSIHPLISVSDPENGARSFGGIFWCIEGDKRALRLAKTMISDLDGKSFSLDSKDKPLYHAAAVMASGNVVALVDVAIEMLGRCGLTRNQAQRILQPLLESTVSNLEVKEPARAMTGTFARGDVETVQQHVESMKRSDLIDALELYRLLGKRALRLADRKHVNANMLKRIARTLGK
jgi:predicted short-subunit dehydrogenase-like oxidoreductase (DUF2520 family)